MIIGIVGNEGGKFTKKTEKLARLAIANTFIRHHLGPMDMVVSGKCHMGGIDVWAIEEAIKAGHQTDEFPPAVLKWKGTKGKPGFYERNIQIAKASDLLINIVVAEYPTDYLGMRFTSCYHCKTSDHVKSGGCWTMKYARDVLGKPVELIVV